MHDCSACDLSDSWHGHTCQHLQPSAGDGPPGGWHVPALFGGTEPCPSAKSPPPPIHEPVTLPEKQRPTYALPMPFCGKQQGVAISTVRLGQLAQHAAISTAYAGAAISTAYAAEAISTAHAGQQSVQHMQLSQSAQHMQPRQTAHTRFQCRLPGTITNKSVQRLLYWIQNAIHKRSNI